MKFEDTYFDRTNKYIYFFSYDLNGLFRINLINNVTDFLITIKEYPKDAIRLFGSVIKSGNYLIFAPLSANEILIYDVETNEYELIPIKKRNDYKGDSAKFYATTSLDGKVYLFPSHYPAIVQLDLKTRNIKYYSDWLEKLTDYTEKGNDYFRQSVCCRNNKIIAPFCYSDDLLLFDVDDCSSQIIHIETDRTSLQGFSGIVDDGNDIWLSSMFGSELYRWNYKSDQVDAYYLGNKNNNSYSYVGCLSSNGKVIVKPSLKNDLCIVDVGSSSITRISPKEYGLKKNNGFLSTVFSATELNIGTYLLCTSNGDLFNLKVGDKVCISDFTNNLSSGIESWARAKGGEFSSIAHESKDLTLDIFMKMI